MNAFAEFHFLRPAWLLALALIPLAWWFWRHRRGEAGNWQAVVDAHLLPHLIETAPERSRRGGIWLAGLIWSLACLALAGPAWERESLPLYRNEAARVLAIELAPTMLAADIKPTRLARARYKLNDILAASRDMQTALIGYSGDAFVAAPLTDDVNTVRNLIDALDPGVMPVVGNNTERAIDVASRLIEQAGLKGGELILLADSVSTRALAAARAAHRNGLVISVLGVGSDSGAPVPLPQGGFLQDAQGNIVLPRLDEQGLRALAEAGGGHYARLSADRSDLGIVLGSHNASRDTAKATDSKALSARYRDRGPWLVLALLPLAMLAFRRGWLMALALALLAPAPPVQAMEWMDLWQRPDQRAAKALAEGDAARAQALAKDPQWQGSAAYRAGDFASASAAFAKSTGAQAQYNRGNALAREGKYEDAIEAYRKSLEASPGMEDAEANKRAVEEWLKRQQDQQQNNNQQQNQQGSGRDQQGQNDNSQSGQSSNQQQDAGKQGQQPSDQDKGGESPEDAAGEKDKAGQEDSSADSDKNSQAKPEDDKSGRDSSSDSDAEQKAGDANSKSAAETAQEKQQREQQQAQMAKAIDKALDGKPGGDQKPPSEAAAMNESEREQQQALNQWLQRVPDDPGGLLRRKFQLEYDQRQRDGGDR
jgi:Ca-activated chloride channel family protein